MHATGYPQSSLMHQTYIPACIQTQTYIHNPHPHVCACTHMLSVTHCARACTHTLYIYLVHCCAVTCSFLTALLCLFLPISTSCCYCATQFWSEQLVPVRWKWHLLLLVIRRYCKDRQPPWYWVCKCVPYGCAEMFSAIVVRYKFELKTSLHVTLIHDHSASFRNFTEGHVFCKLFFLQYVLRLCAMLKPLHIQTLYH